MRVRPWPFRPFNLRNVAIVGWCLLAAALIQPSRQFGAPADGTADRTPQTPPKLAKQRPSKAQQARTVAAYGKLPLGFEANQGQTDSRVRFLSRGSGYLLYLTPGEAVLALESERPPQSARTSKLPHLGLESAQPKPPAVLRMQLVGSNARAGMVGSDLLPGKSNYFLSNDPSQWRTNVPNYRRVAENAVYPGIDLIYYGTQSQLEYDFVVAPGADPHAIRLAVQGAKKLRIDPQGNLIASVGKGDVTFQRPVAYQEDSAGTRQTVAARFSIKGGRNVEFKVGKHDPSRSLVIDPTLAYSTYVGGSLIDGANGIAVAPDDSAFITGETFSVDFPTVDARFGVLVGGEVAFVSKISPDGSALLYSTYLGCVVNESSPVTVGPIVVGNAIAVDSLGEAYATGTVNCGTFPVTEGAFDTLCGADGKCGTSWNTQGFIVYNGWVAKFNVEGSALIYATYIGEYSNCAGRGIAVDASQQAYVTGDIGPNIMETVPLVPPETPPPLFCTVNGGQTSFGGSGGNPYGGFATDAFVIKIDASGSDLLYCTYIGGSDEDVGYGIAVDTAANAYVTGVAYSSDFPTGGGALQTTYGGAGDAFLTKVNTNAFGPSSLVFSTYLGGSGLDQGNGVAVDTSGNAYVAGITTSRASTLLFTQPPGAFQADCALDTLKVCEGDAFVAKVALSGTPAMTYFTYLGGSLADSANGIALDSSDDAYVTGSTTSTNFPIAGTVFQPTYGGGNADAFITELNPTGSDLVYSTYLGGSATDIGNGIGVNLSDTASCATVPTGTACSAYVAGQTCSFDFPLANPLQPNYGGNCDAFVSKASFLVGIALNPAGLLFPTESLGTTSQAETVTLTNGDNTLTINSITLTGAAAGDFAETNNCPATMPPGAQCTITVTFTPTALGIRKASIEITDSAPGSPQYISLTGSTSTVGIQPASVAFGSQAVSVPSAAQPVTITNVGTTALTITAVVTSGAFTETNDCTAAPLQPTANCVVNLGFTPIAPGPNIGALTITDSAPGSPQVVLLTGTGVAAPVASLSPTTLTFPTTTVAATSPAETITVTNTGGAGLTISSVAATGNFAQTNNCPTSLPGGASCAISVTFTPTAPGNLYGTVVITDNAANSPQTVTLSGIGGAAPVVSLSATSLTFTSQALGATSAPQTITMTNSGTATLTIASITVTGDFAELNTCGTGLAPAASCAINVTFTPTAAGSRTGLLTITDNAAGSPQVVNLGGGGADFIVSVAPASTSVVAGGAASYTITVTPSFGFNAKVNLGCVGAPRNATCSISPSSVTPDGTNPISATVTVATTARTLAPPRSGPNTNLPRLVTHFRPTWFMWFLFLLALATSQAMARRRGVLLRLALVMGLVLLWAACGAGGSQVNLGDGTPAGSYQLTLSGTAGTPAISHSTTVSLSVQ
ncbi:MAG: choice-of-anchor D domain-containing protein [Terriglobia bacterium]|jgi:hypothetical protein